MSTAFWDEKIVILVGIIEWGYSYSSQNRRRNNLSPGVILISDTARPQTPAFTKRKIQSLRWGLLKTLHIVSNLHLRLLSLLPYETVAWWTTVSKRRGTQDCHRQDVQFPSVEFLINKVVKETGAALREVIRTKWRRCGKVQ